MEMFDSWVLIIFRGLYALYSSNSQFKLQNYEKHMNGEANDQNWNSSNKEKRIRNSEERNVFRKGD